MLTKDLAFYSYCNIMDSEYDELQLFASVLMLFVDSTDPHPQSLCISSF